MCPLRRNTLSTHFRNARFITNKSHDFYRFSDAALHWNCYVKWPHQGRLASMYFEVALQRSELTRSQHRKTLMKSPEVLVEYWFEMNEVSVMLRKSGTEIRLHRSRWQAWLDGAWRSECRPELEHNAVSECIPQLRELQLPESNAQT